MHVRLLTIACLLLLTIHAGAQDNLVDAGEPFGELALVDEVLCGDPGDAHEFAEGPEGVSVTETLLGTPCRVLPTEGEAKYFAYRIGEGRDLAPGAAYVLSIEYPEDQPRSMFIGNRGCESILGFATGATVGDVLHGRYVDHNPESLQYPLSGELEQWKTLFYLHDRFPDINQPRGEGDRPMAPDQGFWVVVSQSKGSNHPMSAGAAVSRIRLFEVPEPERFDVQLNLPPDDLPRRHVFYREEMSDGVIQSRDETKRGVTDDIRWFEYKLRQMRFWGFNTFCKDLLEFGHNQGWDSAKYGGNNWVNQSKTPDRWAKTLELVGRYGFDVLPYYEYAGSVGARSIGTQRRCRPLGETNEYTHISWSEIAYADVTDPEQLEDLRRVLELTIVEHKDKANFIGAWLRTRPSHIPISFADAALFKFAVEANDKVVALREDLQNDPELLQKYYDWWFGKRREFLVAMRDYLRAEVNPDALVMFTAIASEPVPALPGKQLVTDDAAAWEAALAEHEDHQGMTPRTLDDVVGSGDYLTAVLSPHPTWAEWEWQHSLPEPDPHRYTDTDGVLLTYPYSRAYTVGSPEAFEAFRGPSGLAIARHYPLNENEMEEKVGYFVADVERSGPYCMMAEARAVANGDPRYIGYLASNSLNRGFPEYVRRFCAAFLALPALPSEIVEGAASDDEVAIRAIPTEEHGTYYAVVNTGLSPKPEVTVTLPAQGEVTDAATGEKLEAPGGKLTLAMDACELRAVRVN